MNFSEKIDKVLIHNEKDLRSIGDLEEFVGLGLHTIRSAIKDKREPTIATQVKIVEGMGINWEWWTNETGEIFRGNITRDNISPTWSKTAGVKIPFYDAIAVAGLTTLAADQTPTYEPAEFIDAGTWFRTATAAMRIAGDSMFPKYRPGCVVALREVFDKDDIDYGKDYVIETTENRWLKCLTKSDKGEDYVELKSYSSSKDDKGRLIHASRDMHKNKIKRIYRVLGQVLHESGGEDILQRGADPKMTIHLQEK